MDGKTLLHMYGVISQCCEQWNNHLIPILTDKIQDYLTKLYVFSLRKERELNGGRAVSEVNVLKRFREYCLQLEDWSVKELNAEIMYFESVINNFENVLNLVVQLNFKVNSAFRPNTQTKLKFKKVAKNDFIQQCYQQSAIKVGYNYPSLFSGSERNGEETSMEHYKNFEISNHRISCVVNSVIFSFSPINKLTNINQKQARINTTQIKSEPKETKPRDKRDEKLMKIAKKEELKALGYTLEDIQKRKHRTVDIKQPPIQNIKTSNDDPIQNMINATESLIKDYDELSEKQGNLDLLEEKIIPREESIKPTILDLTRENLQVIKKSQFTKPTIIQPIKTTSIFQEIENVIKSPSKVSISSTSKKIISDSNQIKEIKELNINKSEKSNKDLPIPSLSKNSNKEKIQENEQLIINENENIINDFPIDENNLNENNEQFPNENSDDEQNNNNEEINREFDDISEVSSTNRSMRNFGIKVKP